MVDLDQGGTSRQWSRNYLGPSVGWIDVPLQNLLPVTTDGTYALDPSTNFVEVNVAGAVTIILPSCQTPAAGAQAQPRLFALNPITIIDIGQRCGQQHHHSAEQSERDGHGSRLDQDRDELRGVTLQTVPGQKTWTSISP